MGVFGSGYRGIINKKDGKMSCFVEKRESVNVGCILIIDNLKYVGNFWDEVLEDIIYIGILWEFV